VVARRQRAGKGRTATYLVGEEWRGVGAADLRWLRQRPGNLRCGDRGPKAGNGRGGVGSSAVVGIGSAGGGVGRICSGAWRRGGGIAAATLNWDGAG
jgi:hypothetical protein